MGGPKWMVGGTIFEMWLGGCEASPRPASPRISQDRMGGGNAAHARAAILARPVPVATILGSYAAARTRTVSRGRPRFLPASLSASSCQSAVRPMSAAHP